MVNGNRNNSLLLSRLMVFAAAVFILSNFAIAGSANMNSNMPKSQMDGLLNASLLRFYYAHVLCNTNNTSLYAGDVQQMIGTSNAITSNVMVLQQDNAQLQTYAGADNLSGFVQYRDAAYRPQLVFTRNLISTTVSNANLNSSQKTQLRDEYTDARSKLATCYTDAIRQYADAKLTFYQDTVYYDMNMSNNLGNKGANVSNLNALEASAMSDVMVPLQNAVNSATNASQISAALHTYCLGSGCIAGMNYHLWAKFDAYYLGDEISWIRVHMNLTNSTTLNRAQDRIDTALGILSSIGNSTYAHGQDHRVWSSISRAKALVDKVMNKQ